MLAMAVFCCWLYDVAMSDLLYLILLLCSVMIGFGIRDYWNCKTKHRLLRDIHQMEDCRQVQITPQLWYVEKDYEAIYNRACRQKDEERVRYEKERKEMFDYYGMWVHQIKTPIAASRLVLQQKEYGPNEQKILQMELMKIEQYVEMVLSYLRMSDASDDFVFREYPLDALLKTTIKKFTQVFIYREISLVYEPTNLTVLTDEKWLSFVLEQLLTNALKYTKEGGRIHIFCKEEQLYLEDDGIGIASQDLPRVFEKGFTGYNGRQEQKATGIGLYLCKRVMEKLCCDISITSAPGKGTTVRLDLKRNRYRLE